MLVRITRAWEQRETHPLVIQLVTLIIILRAPNLIDCHLLQPPQQRIADLAPVDESLVKSCREDRPSTNSYLELIYPVVITIHNLSNLAASTLNRELQGVREDLHHPNVKHLNKEDHHNNKPQLQCSS